MFDNYPKKRIPLSERMQAIYAEHYKSNREGNTTASSLAQKMERWLHKKVAADVESTHTKRTLEIGAGTLNQLQYELPEHYDIVEPFHALYADSPYLKHVQTIYSDIDEIQPGKPYDRIISVATFEHITDLPKVVAKCCLLLHSSGVLRTSIPNEGTLLWTMGWRLTTGLEFRLRYGMDYGKLIQHEHVNTACEIEDVLRYFFNVNHCQVFGINKRIAFYRYYESREPKLDVAEDYLRTLANQNRT